MIAIIFALALLLFGWERHRAGWVLPPIARWPWHLAAANAAQLALVLAGGLLWDRYFQRHCLWHLGSHLSPWAGGGLAYFIATFVYYWWHRARHAASWLWLGLHQLHHSPARIEVLMAFYKHPAAQLANALFSSLLVYAVLGLSPAGAATAALLSASAEFFYHLNVRTPRWVGYFVQRPEMPRLHHACGAHHSNYGDLPLWDLLFGTYQNPVSYDGSCGFAGTPSWRAMLLFRDEQHRRES